MMYMINPFCKLYNNCKNYKTDHDLTLRRIGVHGPQGVFFTICGYLDAC